MRCLGSRNANPSTFGARTHECINPLWRTAACCAWSQLSVLRKRHIKILRLHDFNRGDLRVRCLGSRNANPSTFAAHTQECINPTAACCAWSQLSAFFRKRHIKVLRLHDFDRGDSRVRCLGSRNAFGARNHECINPLWRTAACCAWSQLSVLRKRHIKVLRLHDFNRGDSRVRCLGSRNANPSTLGAHTQECINPLWRTAACCAWSQLSVFRKRHIKVLRLHDFDRGDLRVRCLGSRNANP